MVKPKTTISTSSIICAGCVVDISDDDSDESSYCCDACENRTIDNWLAGIGPIQGEQIEMAKLGPSESASKVVAKKEQVKRFDISSLLDRTNEKSTKRRRVVIVGDSGVGKTWLIQTLKKLDFDIDEKDEDKKLAQYVPTVIDAKGATFGLNEGKDKLYFALWEAGGDPGLQQVRAMAYESCYAILLCFALDSPKSMESIIHRWTYEVERLCPDKLIPTILVGLKKDLRGKFENQPKDGNLVLATVDVEKQMQLVQSTSSKSMDSKVEKLDSTATASADVGKQMELVQSTSSKPMDSKVENLDSATAKAGVEKQMELVQSTSSKPMDSKVENLDSATASADVGKQVELVQSTSSKPMDSKGENLDLAIARADVEKQIQLIISTAIKQVVSKGENLDLATASGDAEKQMQLVQSTSSKPMDSKGENLDSASATISADVEKQMQLVQSTSKQVNFKVDDLNGSGKVPTIIKSEEVVKAAKEIHAFAHVECSSVTQEGMQELIEILCHAVLCYLHVREPPKSSKKEWIKKVFSKKGKKKNEDEGEGAGLIAKEEGQEGGVDQGKDKDHGGDEIEAVAKEEEVEGMDQGDKTGLVVKEEKKKNKQRRGGRFRPSLKNCSIM